MRELIYLLLHIHAYHLCRPRTTARHFDTHFSLGSEVIIHLPNHAPRLPTSPSPPHPETRSGLAVSLPQRSIPFEVEPIYHATSHGRRQRIFSTTYIIFDTYFWNI